MTDTGLEDALETLKNNCVVDASEGLDTLVIYINNIIDHPTDQRFRKIRLSNVNYEERLGHLNGGQALLEAIGFQETKGFLILPEHLYCLDQAELQLHLELVGKTHAQLKKKFANPPRMPKDHRWKTVVEATVADDIGRRSFMEDDHILLDSFMEEDQQGFFALYDGHGGRGTVDFVVRSLHLNFEHHLITHPDDSIEAAFEKCYQITDGQLRRMSILQSGTTAVTCLIRKENNQSVLYCANTGDSRAVLCRNRKAIRLSKDHKPQDPLEAKRVVDDGGFIGRFSRVNGILAITRALGDHMLKPPVSAVPSQIKTELQPGDDFLIMACDGLWDVVTDQEACDFVIQKLGEYKDQRSEDENKHSSYTSTFELPVELICERLNDVAKELVQSALDKRSLDNITILLIWLNPEEHIT